MISKEDVRYFIQVSETLNLSRAAERLGISQPSLSAAMQRIEHSAKTALLLRHKKGVSLTPAGKQLLLHAKQLQDYWDRVQSRILLTHQEIQGRYTIGCHSSIALTHFGKFMPNLLAQNKKLEVQLKHDNSRKILQAILDASIDIGIVVNPVQHPNLIMQKLCEDETALWHLNEKNKLQSLYSGEAIVICDPDLIQVQSLLKKIQKKGQGYARILSSSNLEVIADLTMNGCGIGILPTSIAVRSGKLKKVTHTPGYLDEFYLVYRPENRELKGIQVIVSAMKTFIKLL